MTHAYKVSTWEAEEGKLLCRELQASMGYKVKSTKREGGGKEEGKKGCLHHNVIFSMTFRILKYLRLIALCLHLEMYLWEGAMALHSNFIANIMGIINNNK